MKTEPKDMTAAALRERIAHVEAQHEMFAQKDVLPDGNAHWVGAKPSDFLRGGDGNEHVATAHAAARGMFVVCPRSMGGCGGAGWIVTGDGDRIACPPCAGSGKITSSAGLAHLHTELELREGPQPKPDATPEALAAHNERARQAREAREQAQREHAERQAAERRIYGEAQKKIDELRNGPAPDPLVEHEIARQIHEAREAK
ncbi:MAG: hypothetical protein ACHQWU_12240 [Gemmatimonadales bacterium]